MTTQGVYLVCSSCGLRVDFGAGTEGDQCMRLLNPGQHSGAYCAGTLHYVSQNGELPE